MNLPSYCPACGDVMLTEYVGGYSIVKTCSKRVDHSVRIQANNDELILKISVLISHTPLLWAIWHPLTEELDIYDMNKKPLIGTRLPYFEPNLHNYNKLVKKIKTYLLFS